MKRIHSLYTALSLSALLCIGGSLFSPPSRSSQQMVFCGTEMPKPSEALRLETMTQKLLKQKSTLETAFPVTSAAAPTVIDVYFHIITRSDGKGNLTDAQITQLLAVLNEGFAGKYKLPNGVTPLGVSAPTPFQFTLKGIDRTANDVWYEDNDTYAMKSALHKGDAKTLNVYLCSLIPSGLVGYATFPWWYRYDPLSDGVVYDNTSLPGGSGPYSAGRVLAHEVGHWVGLWHTFQGSCEKYNDFVTDTPAEAYPFRGDWFAGGFPGSVPDTCTAKPFVGKDPVDNQMDYSADTSRVRFTAGQVARMTTYCKIYRGL